MPIFVGGAAARVYVGDQLAQSVWLGDVEVWRRNDPEGRGWERMVGGTLFVPQWARFAHVALWGGGGGGAGGDGSFNRSGSGGAGGSGVVDFVPVKPREIVTVTIGAGGQGGAKEKAGRPGGESTFEVLGGASLTAAGGAGGSGYGNATGGAATPGHLAGIGPIGGQTVAGGSPGASPGGGGGGGAGGTFGRGRPGAAGGEGAVWIRWQSY